MNESVNFAHQQSLFDPVHANKVTICGGGSVGGFLTDFLSKAGVPDIEVWDDDVVSSHNCPYSIFTARDIGRYKVDALAERIERDTGIQIVVHREKYVGQVPLRNTSVISCVDSMEETGRARIFENVEGKSSIDIFFDTRTHEHYVEVYAILPYSKEEAARYKASLCADDDAARQMCGAHGIIGTSVRAANIVQTQLLHFWQTGEKKLLVRERCDIVLQLT